jgi:hypothetical protein
MADPSTRRDRARQGFQGRHLLEDRSSPRATGRRPRVLLPSPVPSGATKSSCAEPPGPSKVNIAGSCELAHRLLDVHAFDRGLVDVTLAATPLQLSP